MRNKKGDYPLIRIMDITKEARKIAVAWVDGYERQGMDIPGKQKLASDIMNYGRRDSIRFFKWYALRMVSFLEYLKDIRPAVTNNEIEEKIKEHENSTIEQLYAEYLKTLPK